MDPSPPLEPTATPSRGHLVRLVAVATVFGFALWAVWRWQNPAEPPPDEEPPPLASPYLNTRAGVKYVGDKVCADCHDEARTYKHHPMGRSIALLAKVTPREPDGKDGVFAFDAQGSLFQALRRGGRVVHKEIFRAQGQLIAELEEEPSLVIGSGSQARSYFINRDGRLFESPITWYSHKHSGKAPGKGAGPAWNLSPGYERSLPHFSRMISKECLFCHVNYVTPVENTVNRYREPLFPGQLAIGCERCHGPGELHVARINGGEATAPGQPDFTIVNPGRLEPALRDAVCQQCHLQGDARILRRGRSWFDYRPGLPLQQFLRVFVSPPEKTDNYKIVSHAEQMQVSRCFVASKGKMGCTSCHDPHRLPEPTAKVAYYRQKCLHCHKQSNCKVDLAERRRQQPGDNCVACHMPHAGSSNAIHMSVTDHRILRRSDRPPKPSGGSSDTFLKAFHPNLTKVDAQEMDRDLGLAMIHSLRLLESKDRDQVCQEALHLLEDATERHPDDLAAAEGKGFALWWTDRPKEGLAVFETILVKEPANEVVLDLATRVAVALGETDKAMTYCKRLLHVNPWRADAHSTLGQLLGERRQWKEAVGEGQTALRLNPGLAEVRKTLITAYLHQGKKDAAQAEFKRLLALKPGEARQLNKWFDGQLK
jgi:predicted CXXCH cytochrome family protein